MPAPSTRRRRPVLLALLAAVTLAAGACSDDDGGSASDTRPTTQAARDQAERDQTDKPVFATPGPYHVGVTTLTLPDRSVEVWYPAAEVPAGAQPATYSQLDPLPPALAELARTAVPPDVDLTVETGAFRDVAAAEDGPFPVVLLSHGFGAFRLDNSALAIGIASWGFVVAAPDHLERGRAALLSGTASSSTARDVDVLLGSLGAVEAASTAAGPLRGLADTERVGAVGHSAGGRAALSALARPEVQVAVGWAAAGVEAEPAPPGEPSLNLAARVDVLVPLEEVEQTYAQLQAPKRLVVVDGAGHNSFTDLCRSVREGNDLIGVAQRLGFAIPDALAEGGNDGCAPEALAPEQAWAVTQHFTVAQLRAGLGLDTSGAGLGAGVADAFPEVTLDYRQDL